MRIAAIIVAAGRGIRAGGDIPKQYQDLRGQAVLARTVGAFLDHPRIDEVVVVANTGDAALYLKALGQLAPRVTRVSGADSRDGSVRAGLAAVAPGTEAVLIHDGARPLVAPDLIDRVLDALATHPGAAPALPVTDALWRGQDGAVTASQPREGLFRAQTPQGFHLGAIRAAHAAHPGGAADDVEVALAAGLDVAIVEGDETNLKITHPGDFARAARILKDQPMDIRTGNGFDVHRFGEGDHVMLCGVHVPHDHALMGHSDADVGMHALTDAIYGALAMGDIGQHFPPSDMQWKGAESHIFLRHAALLAAEHGFAITHCDVTLICERPKIGPHAAAMRAALAEIIGIDATRISVKATTSERLGFTGREEGIAALATATLVKS
ncbi:bifunctional 2-C-methyl-D-erythritol 4-phosphate cytidylyltransferase/2-C-methyl-D-erythritol 2,4-cyclodiphosphate synthase [Actibacterium sp. XHP0104]|uniref:bifunctional 2-C-methyl-D-erythritol 4-phosphate cytidylyltransferase/2-C-methyl-D-erythritol 2,4-cyclodiphosphate synthase n=1 Tax=Actibacterium sp. XHP0104 TaxID=2984335 RepID=UPI0021E86E50|nr:bifunctional 2-C-methyl-D-erythritol 4-phosphate cytidylyltransferase/2-C-methyl-D-erythritol 2,4-cyclodiphosphate synthase [Actibacterium sp. XHP0104]MCV2881046.1 bifunctional 2-C-methyl-D-erythritol 4-phosphate cytidylyltransferase/2-C-methyl-D-erythritol 2,4-cyclodiphosphate synthase [Actibacterium sp. XHP0104]